MLVVRGEQMEALRREAERAFRERLRAMVLRTYIDAQRWYPDGKLDAVIASAIEDARRRAFTLQTTIADFVGLAVQFGPAFHTDEEVERVLSVGEPDEAKRLALLFSEVSASAWARMAKRRREG